MFQIVLVGVGNLGSRYLQGLEKLDSKAIITVIDPSVNSINRAKALWNNATSTKFIDAVIWKRDLLELPNFIDLVIVSTTADTRLSVIETITNNFLVNYWVLEKVLAQSKSQLMSINDYLHSAKGVWVNTPRRIMVWHNHLKKMLLPGSGIQFERIGSDWGLACNSVHFIDLVVWLTGEQLVSIDVSSLANSWHESKRSGFYEVFGTLEASFSLGSKLRLTDEPNQKNDYEIIVTDAKTTWMIDEEKGIAMSELGQKIDGQLELQSDMTYRLVNDILELGRCRLPTLQESYKIHSILIEQLLSHWNHCKKCNDQLLPVT
tara:strand:+ start:2856 stop:3812 length:957 start_codon:yes stop_codon:yes gene_type:complete